MDGLSATKIIKADPDLKDIPIFALSGFAMESDKQKAADLGLAGYIVKPISVKGLLETLANCFNPPHAEK
jgi:CheY-like chemotaxis protein